jgi:glycosyltransferase involved in cell wall biosynthesis
MTKIAFTTNLCAHYNVGTFNLLTKKYETDFYFYSAGNEWYWQQEHGARSGEFKAEYLKGFQIGNTRISPSLPWKLLIRNYDVYIKCINGRFALPVTYLIARIKRKPFILWTGVWTRIQTPFQRLVFPLTRFIYCHSDAIVVYGEHVKSYLISEGVPSERVFVAPHAVDNEFYNRKISEAEQADLRNRLGLLPDQKIVLYLGRLEEIKGLEYLIEAFEYFSSPDVVLVLAGDGGLRTELETLAKKKNLSSRIRFAGYVPVENAPLYYSLAWVSVLASVTTLTGKELWGLVVNEAFNQGVPVIATKAVGAAAGGLLQDGVNGLIVPERNSQAIAEALTRLIEAPDLHHQLSENARKIVVGWNYENNVLGYYQAVEYVLANQRQ